MSEHIHRKIDHPLSCTIKEVLDDMTKEQLQRRLGVDRAKAFARGELDLSHYPNPPSGVKFDISELKKNDILRFKSLTQE